MMNSDDLNAWRTSNVVFGRCGEILYPSVLPCPTCGMEVHEWPQLDHPFERHVEASEEERDEICVCGRHESYHRGHDCVKDNEGPPIACACSGGQPWSCCVNRYSRQRQFLLQKVANALRAATQRREMTTTD